MSKKKGRGAPAEPKPPQFGGFKPLAAGLGDIKARLEAEKREADEKSKAKPAPKAPPPRAPSPSRDRTAIGSSDLDDEHAFHRMMSGVVPLENRGGRVPVGAGTKVAPVKAPPVDLRKKAREEAEAVLDHLHQLVDGGVRFEVTDDGRRVEGRRIDVPPSLLRELRRGVLPIDGRLDLHGLAAEAAREKLVEFLRTKRTHGDRCVLVIHGKGEHSAVPGGVLRGEIAAWLSQGRAREHVAAFATASAEDGGEGAVYVALRR